MTRIFLCFIYSMNGHAYLGTPVVLDTPATHSQPKIAKLCFPKTYSSNIQAFANIALCTLITINTLFVTFQIDFTTEMDNMDTLDLMLRLVRWGHPMFHQTGVCRATDQRYLIHDAWWRSYKSSGVPIMQQRVILDHETPIISHSYHGIYGEL